MAHSFIFVFWIVDFFLEEWGFHFVVEGWSAVLIAMINAQMLIDVVVHVDLILSLLNRARIYRIDRRKT